MKEHFTMYSIVVIVSGKCVHVDTEAMCITFCNAAWYRDERKCSHKSISEEKLQKIVRSELTRQFQLSGLRKKDMSVISSAVFLSKINEIQTEIRKLDADMERRSEKTGTGIYEI